MFKYSKKMFVNAFGVEEQYVYKELEQYLSGHLYRRSEYESDNSCGNCDGARCDSCELITVVTLYSEPQESVQGKICKLKIWKRFTNEKEALEYYNSL